MWRMLVGFLPLSQPAGAVYPSRPILFQSGNLLFFFPFSSFFFPPHLTKISGKAEQGHENKPQLWSWAQAPAQSPAVATGALLGAHQARSMHPDPSFSQELGSPKSALEEEFSGF